MSQPNTSIGNERERDRLRRYGQAKSRTRDRPPARAAAWDLLLCGLVVEFIFMEKDRF
jgi:hypothetical protein